MKENEKQENSGKENHPCLSIILFRYVFSGIVCGGRYLQRRGKNPLRVEFLRNK
jgi:hypothetical protein